MRRARRFLVVALLVGAVYFGITFVQVVSASRRDQARPAEAIVVLGAAQYDGRPSPVLRARLDHAADLYADGLAKMIVVTGGSRPGDRSNEAAASHDYLVTQRDVPSRVILRESAGRDSWESLASAANELRKRNLGDVLLVSDPFHNARILAMADELRLHAHVSPTRTSPIRGGTELNHLARETVAVGVGRVVGFRRLMGIERRVVRNRGSNEAGSAVDDQVSWRFTRSGVV